MPYDTSAKRFAWVKIAWNFYCRKLRSWTEKFLFCVYLKLFQGSWSLLNLCSNSFIKATITLLKKTNKQTKKKQERPRMTRPRQSLTFQIWIQNHKLRSTRIKILKIQPGRNGEPLGRGQVFSAGCFLTLGEVKGKTVLHWIKYKKKNNWTNKGNQIRENALLGRTSSSSFNQL